MPRKIQFTLKLTEEEKSKLAYSAKVKGVSMSELIQDFCKQLPKPSDKKD